MNNNFIQIVRFLALVATQVLIMNKVQFNGYVNPYIYVLFIVILPLRTPHIVTLALGFLLGFVMDYFSGMLGIHTFATLFVSYFRVRFLRFTTGVTEDDFLSTLGIYDLGTWRFLRYAGFLVVIHHTLLLFMEVFSVKNIEETLIRVAVNSLVSLAFIFVIMILFERKKND